MEIRKNFVMGLIGANGTGKTSVTKEMVKDWRSSRPNQSVIGFDQHRQFDGLVDFYINPSDKNWAIEVWRKCKNSLIILDDYKALVPNYVPTPGMREIFIDRRLNNNDVIYSCHSPGNVIDMLTDFTTHYYIFHTKNTEGKFKDKMPNAELCIGASRYVNKYTAIYGLGQHPNAPNFLGQKFPYIIANTETQRLTAVNMHNKINF